MTKVPGVPDRDQAKPGMAYFAGTGPAKRCGDCKFRSYRRSGRTTHACAMFHELTGRHGPEIRKDYDACKYFQPKPRDQ
jgi:hypothetical protein